MDPSPRQVAALSLLALVPIGIYGAFSGHLTVVTGILTVLGVFLIAGMLLLLFGPAPGDSGDGAAH